MHPKLVIFDFDDTLLHLNVDWPSVKSAILREASGAGIAADPSLHLVRLANDISQSPEGKKIVDSVFLRHEAECAANRRYERFPAMLQLANDLKSGGARLAIASGNHTSSINRILSDIGMGSAFDVVCGRDMVVNNKPAPDQLILIMGRIRAAKNDAVFIGDSINDRLAAEAAGVRYLKAGADHESAALALRKELLG